VRGEREKGGARRPREVHRAVVPAAKEGLGLHEAVVRTAQDRLRLLDRVNLARASFAADVEILQKEITGACEGSCLENEKEGNANRTYCVGKA
jgi:hypothetical protein